MEKRQYHRTFLFAALGIMLIVALYSGLTQKNPAPAVTMTDLVGKTINLSRLHGRTVLIDFWATSCPGCVQEMPKLVELYDRNHAQGFDLVAVAMNYDDPDQIRRFAADRKLPFPVVYDSNGAIAHAFGDIKLTPTSFLIAPDGRIVEQTIGDPDFAKLQQRLSKEAGQT
ncbi:MAG TPA: TlpA disulfide reductase family protein [Burkholderiales bacterium]|nr:TlpA disulfide reductase family protein [Burkholderiales bacterium]